MAEKLFLAVCESYAADYRAAIVAEALQDIEIIAFRSTCARGRMSRNIWPDSIHNPDLNAANLIVVCGTCYPLQYLPDALKTAKIITRDNCLHYLTNAGIVDQLVRQGGYLVTSGWLMNWQEYIDAWGFDAAGLKRFFSEFAKKIVVLDTGINPDCRRLVGEFSKQAGLPYKIFSIDLMYLGLFIRNLLLEWRLSTASGEAAMKTELSETKKALVDSAKTNAEYAMMFDIISKLSEIVTEEEVVKQLLDHFMLLFMPRKLGYHCLSRRISVPAISHANESLVQECIDHPHHNHLYSATGNGFLLRLEFRGEVYGVVEIDELAFPHYRDRYLSMLLNVGKVCGLAISNARKYEAVSESNEQLQYVNIHDQLTGIHNRVYFETQLQLMANNPCIQSIGVFMCDVDGLKTVNDTIGHAAGDQLIIAAANILAGCFRENDAVARIGGDEFAVLLPNCTDELAAVFNARIVQAIAKHNEEISPRLPGAEHVSLSAGWAVGNKPFLDTEKLIQNADTQMYRQKAEKRSKT